MDIDDVMVVDDCCDCDRCCASRRAAHRGEYVWSVCDHGFTVRSQQRSTTSRACTTEGGVGKRTYPNRREARIALRHQQTAGKADRGLMAYRCTYCGWYHLGHDPEAS